MRIVISLGHATQRMAQRQITRQDIENAVAKAHTTWPGDKGGTTFVGPGMNGKDLLVWTLPRRPSATTLTVKSAAWRDTEDA